MHQLLDIGTKVQKKKKPFKSGNRINTIKGYVPHPHFCGEVMAYTFEEDDSYVRADKCKAVDEPTKEV